MTSCRFCLPDATVVRNFETVGRIDLLETYLDGQGRWVEAVEAEIFDAKKYVEELRDIDLDNLRRFLGESIEIYEAEEVEDLRVGRLHGPADKPRKNLGEAQTLHLIMNDPAFAGAKWLTDDRSAADFARGKEIATIDTTGVIDWLCGNRYIGTQDGFKLLRIMHEHGNHIRLPASHNDLGH